MYNVVKRDGKIVDFDLTKIKNAITKAFDACEKQYNQNIIDFVHGLSEDDINRISANEAQMNPRDLVDNPNAILDKVKAYCAD